MAEWLGHFMAGWPIWLVALVLVVGLVIAVIVMFLWSLAEGSVPPFGNGVVSDIRRRKRGKK